MKKVSREEAENCICKGQQVYMLTPITTMTTVVEYLSAREFCVEESQEEVKKKSSTELKNSSTELKKSSPELKKTGPAAILLDYDAIMKMREDGATYDTIGEKMNCSGQTIINFLKREGKKRRESNT